MIWVLVIIVVIAIYNAERLPEIIGKMKNEVPNIVEAGKKVSKELKEKAQAAHQEKSEEETATKKKSKEKTDEK